jgi:hypothetical protein
MSDERVPNDVTSAWQADTGGHLAVSPDELRSRIARVSRRTARRTVLGLVVCVLVLASWVYVWWLAPVQSGLARAGILLTCLGTGVLVFRLIVNRDIDEDEWRARSERGAAPSLAFHRWQLERQRDFHRGWRLWTPLLLLTLGGVLFFVGFAGEHPEVARTLYLELIAVLMLAAAALPVNARLARRYQVQLDELDTFGKDRP